MSILQNHIKYYVISSKMGKPALMVHTVSPGVLNRQEMSGCAGLQTINRDGSFGSSYLIYMVVSDVMACSCTEVSMACVVFILYVLLFLSVIL